MVKSEERRAARDEKLDVLQRRLTDAVEQLVTGDDWKRALEFAARFRARSFNNTLLIWTQHLAAFDEGRVLEPTPSLVAGFKQWQTLGRQVEKGQSGYMIYAPVMGRFASRTPAVTESWRRLARYEKPQPGEATRSRLIGVRPAYVWDVSQTNGEPIPSLPQAELLVGEAPGGLWDGLTRQIHAAGFTVVRVPHEGMIHGANGLTDFGERTVAVRENMDPAAQVKTLSHELAHVLLHGPDQPDAVRHRGIGEVEAESVALMIGAAHGMDTSSYTIPYVAGWAGSVNGKSPVEVVQATGERVRKTAASILDQLDTGMISNGDPPGLIRDLPQRSRAPEQSAPPVSDDPLVESCSSQADVVVRGM